MTRVAVFSDTHGRLDRLPEAIRRAGSVDAFLHLGDFGGDAAHIHSLLPVPYFAVRGNCDFSDSKDPKTRVVRFEDVLLFMTHGDGYATIYAPADDARKNGCQAALFGHTHEPLLRADGTTLLVNPGSLSKPIFDYAPSFAILEIEGKTLNVRMISLES